MITDNRTPEQKEEDRAAMLILKPGMAVQHTLYPGHRSIVVRTFTDEAGDWVERSDGTARPRFFEPVENDDVATGQTYQRKRDKVQCWVTGATENLVYLRYADGQRARTAGDWYVTREQLKRLYTLS